MADTKEYILLDQHFTVDGVLPAGSKIELTDEKAANLANKVRLASSEEEQQEEIPAEDSDPEDSETKEEPAKKSWFGKGKDETPAE